MCLKSKSAVRVTMFHPDVTNDNGTVMFENCKCNVAQDFRADRLRHALDATRSGLCDVITTCKLRKRGRNLVQRSCRAITTALLEINYCPGSRVFRLTRAPPAYKNKEIQAIYCSVSINGLKR